MIYYLIEMCLWLFCLLIVSSLLIEMYLKWLFLFYLRDLIKIIIYGYMNGKLKNMDFDDISNNKVNSILKEKRISIKSLPGYGNLGLKKGDLKTYEKNEKCSIKLKD